MEKCSRYIPFSSRPNLPRQATYSSDDDDGDDPPQTQHPSPPIPPPAQLPSQPTPSVARLRSLSRSSTWNIFSRLPTFEQVQMDVIDFWCQAVILETDSEQSALYQRNLEDALHVVKSTAPPDQSVMARLYLAACAGKLVIWQFGQVRSTKEGSVSAYNFTAVDWKRTQEEWNEMREVVVKARPDHEQDDLLQGDFRAVGRLLHYQHILALFCWSLQKENQTSVQESIEMLENAWHKGDFEEEHSSLTHEQKMLPSLIRTILEPVKKRRPDIDECLQRCRDLLWGDESNEFSRAHLQLEMHALIIRWSESILGIPTLFHLQYAGVAPYTVQGLENDNVSLSLDDEDDHSEAHPSVEARRSVTSQRVLLPTGHSESPRTCTQSQDSDTQASDSGDENNQEVTVIRVTNSSQPTRATELRNVNENAPVHRERWLDSWRDTSVEENIPIGYQQQKRLKFNSEEVKAIREGVRCFGPGKWKQIKANDERLEGRTAVQIKDKYRTMLQNNEI